MSGFVNKNVRFIALIVPIFALKSYCWASMPNLQAKGLSIDDARELCIKRFENLIKIHLNRCKITSAKTMYRWLLDEYTESQIAKFRMLNFSKFDMNSIEYDNKRV